MRINLKYSLFLFALVLGVVACSNSKNNLAGSRKISDDSLLTLVQKKTFEYFWNGAEPHSGMARERININGVYPQHDKNIVATGGSGFGVMAILVGMKRGFITRQQGILRLQRITNFLANADRFHGAWPHWLHGKTGKVKPFSKKDDGGDLVETAYMVQGLICARQYLRKMHTKKAHELAAKMNKLWRQVNWNWYRKGGKDILYWHWSPDYGWAMNFPIKGYNETLITYILAASSPTHGVPAAVYHKGWARGGAIDEPVTTYGYKLALRHDGAKKYGGPLFWAHYSYLGLDPHGLHDQYANYWKENKDQTLINREWCIKDPDGYKGYGKNDWGLTASYDMKKNGKIGYAAHQPGKDDGVIAPTAALSSFPYTPKYSMKVLKNFYYNLGDSLWGRYGFYDAFRKGKNWYPKRYLAIDEGPIVDMIENYRSGFLWKLFMSAPEIKRGLKKLGFSSPDI